LIRTLVVSDLHLDPSDPSRYEAIMAAVASVKCDQLVLAGDLFEAWIGDDGAEAADSALLRHFSKCASETVFIPGNRDFLLSQDYAAQFGIRSADKLELPGILILHGDELCTLDTAYQQFKAQVRDRQWQHDFLAKPLSERQAIAHQMRLASKQNQTNRPEAIGDAVEETIQHCMQAANADLLIHGHTHRPTITANAQGLRAVTSDWTDSGIGYVVEHGGREHRRLHQVCLTPTGSDTLQTWNYDAGTPEWKRNSESRD